MIKEMNIQELIDLRNSDNEFILVDCREQDEWNAGHIEGAEFIPLSEFNTALEKLSSYKNKTVVMQCRSGKRSMNACEFLKDNGYTDLYNLTGGILAWIEEGHGVKS